MNQSTQWSLNKRDFFKSLGLLTHAVVGTILTYLGTFFLNTDFTIHYHGATYLLTPFVVMFWAAVSKLAWQAYYNGKDPVVSVPASSITEVAPVTPSEEPKSNV